MSRKRIRFGSDFFDVIDIRHLPTRAEIAQNRLLTLLRQKPRHPGWLRKHVKDYDRLIATLRGQGHRIKSILFYGQTDWVFCLSEKGRLCGVKGDAGQDSAK